MDKLLLAVRAELINRKGQVRRIARETEISYDTVLRIRDNPEYEPGYFKVAKIAEYLKIEICQDER